MRRGVRGGISRNKLRAAGKRQILSEKCITVICIIRGSTFQRPLFRVTRSMDTGANDRFVQSPLIPAHVTNRAHARARA